MASNMPANTESVWTGLIKASNMESVVSLEHIQGLQGHDYPFENLVFEGGGSKGHGHIGAIKVLEEVGIWTNLRRFAGASVGALTAAWAAFGYTSKDMEEFSSADFKSMLHDSKIHNLYSNLQKHFGWHKGAKFTEWVGKTLATAPHGNGDYDVTFEDLYRSSGIELCITVTNLHQMDCTYCHVKTTPNLPVRKAVRMSIAIPGIFSAVRHKMSGKEEIYVDGGLLNNYPITCFDGWFLSLDPNQTFLQKIPLCDDLAKVWDVSERFGGRNDKTIGVLLYSSDEQEVFQIALRSRLKAYVKEADKLHVPDTNLARKRMKEREIKNAAKTKRDKMSRAMAAFLKQVAEHDADLSGSINREELRTAIEQGGDNFTRADAELLFGEDFNLDTLFDTLDIDGSGEISFRELTAFVERQGLQVLSLFRGFENREIDNIQSFFTAILESMLLTMKRIFVRGDDLDRTIGIDTEYLGTTDLRMENADREFLIKQGVLGCLAFLREYTDKKCRRNKYQGQQGQGGTSRPNVQSNDGNDIDQPAVDSHSVDKRSTVELNHAIKNMISH